VSHHYSHRGTGLRPRRILSYWQECAKQAKQPDNPYQAIIKAEHMTGALKTYARQAAEDIAKEYDLEYKGLQELLYHFAKLTPRISRKLPRSKIEEKIQEYVDSLNEVDRYPWLQSSIPEIMEILYKVGVIGIPTTIKKDKSIDWSSVCYATKDPDKTVHAYGTIVIHPAFWNWITNIETETALRRDYSQNLYSEFSRAIINMVEKILVNIKNKQRLDEDEIEYILAKFLALVNLVLEYRSFPETIDRTVGDLVIKKLDLSLSLLTKTVLFPGVGENLREAVIAKMHENYRHIMLKYPPSPGTRRNNILFNDLETFKLKKQEAGLLEFFDENKLPIFTRLSLTSPDVDAIAAFQKSLEGEGELNYTVVEIALKALRSLQERSKE
jgi:hypothetical protein